MAGAALLAAALLSAAAANGGAGSSAATPLLASNTRAVSWWWDTPASADDPAVAATLEFCKQHRDIVTTLIMRCNVLTCCRAGTGECGNAVNHSIPRGSCTNNNGVGGVLTGEVSPACKKMIPALIELGIRPELWLGEDDSMSSARYLFTHAEETAADLLAMAKANPGLVGFNLDLETGEAATDEDVANFATFLGTVAKALSVAPAGPIRFSADVSCQHDDTGGHDTSPARLDTACKQLAHSGVSKLMNMRTYNSGDFSGWANAALMPALADIPLGVLGVGLGCWVDSRTNGTWNVEPASAKDRVCLLMNQSVQEIDMFILSQGKTPSSKPGGYPVTFPEPFWIPELTKFVAGGGWCASLSLTHLPPSSSLT
jgi:hypothetical protein